MPSRDRYGARRSSQTRPVRAVITVVCDDTRTAVEYFNLLREEFSEQKTIRVIPAPRCGAQADKVIELAKLKKPETAVAGDHTFVLVDTDTNPNVEAVQEACTSAGVKPVLSNPCFEVWTLAHLADTGEAFMNCDAVVKKLKATWRREFEQDFGRKSKADYLKIMANRDEAIKRCRRRNNHNSQSWTEVWQVVEVIVTSPASGNV